jgi:hypothetical protein
MSITRRDPWRIGSNRDRFVVVTLASDSEADWRLRHRIAIAVALGAAAAVLLMAAFDADELYRAFDLLFGE